MIQEFKLRIKQDTIWWKIWRAFSFPKRLYNGWLIKKTFSRILKTSSLDCNPKAETEVHSLVRHQDIYMYLVAIKSFLRYYNNVAVIVHSNGSLNEKDTALLKKHIENISIIKKAEADKIIEKFSKRLVKIRNHNVWGIKLVDTNLINKSKKTILLDGDIIFIKKPNEVIDWIRNEEAIPFYNKGWKDIRFLPFKNKKNEKKWKNLIKRTEHLKMDPKLNAGFIGYSNQIKPRVIEAAVKKLGGYCEEDQTAYSVILGEKKAKPLNPKEYIVFNGLNYNPKAKMIHFAGRFRWCKGYYLKFAKKTIKELKNAQ